MNSNEFNDLLAKTKQPKSGVTLLDKWEDVVDHRLCLCHRIKIRRTTAFGFAGSTTDIFVTLPDGKTYGTFALQFKREEVAALVEAK